MAGEPFSGIWLDAISCPAMRTLLGDNSFELGIAFRVEQRCVPHTSVDVVRQLMYTTTTFSPAGTALAISQDMQL